MPWDLVWGGVLGGAAIAFGVFETIALRSRVSGKPSGTLTAVLRRWLGLDPLHWRRWMLGSGFLALLTWVAGHILLGW